MNEQKFVKLAHSISTLSNVELEALQKARSCVVVKSTNPELDDLPLKTPTSERDDIWYHLILDIFNADKLDDHEGIKAFYSDLIRALQMKPLTDLTLLSVDNEQGRGSSAMQMITTSSITFHSDDKYHNAFLDIFSCKRFDPEVAITLVKQYFSPKKIKAKFVGRAED